MFLELLRDLKHFLNIKMSIKNKLNKHNEDEENNKELKKFIK